MRSFTLLITLIVAVLSLGSAACNRTKVDCEKMCGRTLKECPAEVLVATRKVNEAKAAALKERGALAKLEGAPYNTCLKACKEKKGLAENGRSINDCLKKKDCKAYADCMTKHIR